MKKTSLLFLLLFLLFSQCGDNNPSSNIIITSHIGNWIPSVFHLTQFDPIGELKVDSIMSWKEYLAFNHANRNQETILAVSESLIVIHMYLDSFYTTAEYNYYLDGENLKGDLITEGEKVGTLNFYTMRIENSHLFLHYDLNYSDYYIQVTGISRVILRSMYSAYFGKVPPDDWWIDTTFHAVTAGKSDICDALSVAF